jgi:uncharacterized membrane protein
MIGPDWIYSICGSFFFIVGVLIACDQTHPKRWPTAAFWCLFGASLCAGTLVPSWLLGSAVIVLALIGGLGLTGRGSVRTTSDAEREASATRLRNLLFVPALTIPAVTVIVALTGGRISFGGRALLAPGTQTLVGLGVATVAALVVGWVVLRPKNPAVAFVEGRRLLEAIGWATLLPQMLATLGLLFTQAGVGTQVGSIMQHVVPEHSRVLAVLAYALGMALFTIIMGNAFAAFPIMTAAVGWPILVQQMGANPAPMFAIGMLAGFCGTLCTPMAANFNLVPPALLEMKDKYGQIKTQIPTAIALFAVNVGLMLIVPFR